MRGLISYLPQTYAYLNQCTTQPTAKWASALNNFINQLIIDGNWTLLDRLWIFATNVQQNARVSIVNPTSTAITEVSSPTWTMNVGYTGNGSSSYLNTNYNVHTGINFIAASGIYGVWCQADVSTTGIDMGVFDGTDALQLYCRYTDNKFYGLFGGGAGYASATVSSAVGMDVCKGLSGNESIWQNGVQLATVAHTLATPNLVAYILAQNNSGTANNFSIHQLGMAFFGSGSINQLKLYNAFITFLSAI